MQLFFARIIKKATYDVLNKLGIQDKALDIAMQLEKVALEDDYFIERQLYPNVDFYSGIIYRALGIPTDMFTVMFALGRLPGWISQWKEMMEEPSNRIGRPRQLYTGAAQRDYIELKDRSQWRRGITKADIAKEVGLSVTMLGYYYKDKDALVLGCADRFHRDHLREVPSSEIGKKVIEKLYAIDPVAYIRYVSVYRQFSNVEEFIQEITQMRHQTLIDPLQRKLPIL